VTLQHGARLDRRSDARLNPLDFAQDRLYDPLSRLVGADYSSGEQFAYAYDAVGNRTAMTRTITSTLVTTYTYDAVNRLSVVGGQSSVAWDANGNLLSDGTAAYEYNQANRLISATVAGVTTQFAYNGDGVRLQVRRAQDERDGRMRDVRH
jgi:YD repeat-containing protein